MRHQLFAIIFLTCSCSSVLQELDFSEEKDDNEPSGTDVTEIIVDLNYSGGPDISYKRGIAGPGMKGFFYSEQMCKFLSDLHYGGFGIFNGIRSLAKDPITNPAYPFGEFYFDEDSKKFGTSQVEEFTSIRKFAENLGFEMISQIGGTAEYAGFETDKRYTWNSPDFAPLPSPEYMSEFQRCFTEFAINADKAVGEDFHSIWIGTQEITHTIGYPGGVQTQQAKEDAIDRYIDYWKPVSDALRDAGARTGGLQLNSDNALYGLYEYAARKMVEKELQVDFLTYQFYQWGVTAGMEKALEALEIYRKTYPETKIIIDRGGFDKLIETDMTESEALIRFFLKGEKACLDNADKIYAYTLDRATNGFDSVKDNLEWKTKFWMNGVHGKRLQMSNLPEGIDGFITESETGIRGVLWNSGNSPVRTGILLKNFNCPKTRLEISLGSGDKMSDVIVEWSPSKGRIGEFTLNPFEFVLIGTEKI
ncbi:MAG: hypothetical protein ACI395_08660 [Candidatus Cryptobacteroides sp.]